MKRKIYFYHFILTITLSTLLLLITKLVTSSPEDCQSSYVGPPDCGKSDTNPCTYKAFWEYKPEDDSIQFAIYYKDPDRDRWTGIGFTQNPDNLTDVDFIFAWTEGRQRYVMMDAFLPSWGQAIPDRSQNIDNIKVSVTDDYRTFKFNRKRKTNDQLNQDLLFTDDECHYLVFATKGGKILRGHTIEFDALPVTSTSPVCIRACDYKPKPTASLVLPSNSIQVATTTLKPRTTATTTTTTTTTPKPTTTSTTTTFKPSSSTTTTRAPTTRAPTTTSTSTTTTTTSTTTTKPPLPATTSTTTTIPTSSSTTTSTTTTTTSTTTTTTTPAPPSSTTSSQATPSPMIADPQQQWCIGRWSYPPMCRVHPDSFGYVQKALDSLQQIEPVRIDQGDCSYYSQWQYLEQSDSIEFIIQTKSRNRWTGIGFSNHTHMANSDAIIGLFDESLRRHFIMDTWLQNHTIPELDMEQNIDEQNQTAIRKHQTTTFRFKRKRITGDLLDFQFTDDSCAYFFFPVEGGAFNFVNKRIQIHNSIPHISKQRICIRSCLKNNNNNNNNNSNNQDNVNNNNNNDNNKDLKYSAIDSNEVPTTSSPPQQQQTTTTTIPTTTSSASAATSTTTSSSSSTTTATPAILGGGGGGNQIDTDSSPSSASSESHNTSVQPRNNPLNKLAFLSEPSLRWLAGIGCVATLLAVIVFQACFTLYKNKQAYKQNLYRQSVFKQSAYLHHEPYLSAESRHQPSTGSEETQTTASLHTASVTHKAAPPPPNNHHHRHHPNHPNHPNHNHHHNKIAAAAAAGHQLNSELINGNSHHPHNSNNTSSQPSRSQLYRLSMAPYQLHRSQQQLPPSHHGAGDFFEEDHEVEDGEEEEDLEDELEEVLEDEDDIDEEEEEEEEEEVVEVDDIMMDAHRTHYAPAGYHHHHNHQRAHQHHLHTNNNSTTTTNQQQQQRWPHHHPSHAHHHHPSHAHAHAHNHHPSHAHGHHPSHNHTHSHPQTHAHHHPHHHPSSPFVVNPYPPYGGQNHSRLYRQNGHRQYSSRAPNTHATQLNKHDRS